MASLNLKDFTTGLINAIEYVKNNSFIKITSVVLQIAFWIVILISAVNYKEVISWMTGVSEEVSDIRHKELMDYRFSINDEIHGLLENLCHDTNAKGAWIFEFQPAQNEGDPAQGCSNTMMNVMMPAMSAFFTFMVPAAVGIYWMFKSVVSTVKTIIVAKVMPLPTFTEEDYKAAERELAGKDKNKPVKKSGARNPNVRSLHHIDDEDYETTPVERKDPAKKPDYVEPEEEPAAPKTAEGIYGDGVALKEDDRPARNEDDNDGGKWFRRK